MGIIKLKEGKEINYDREELITAARDMRALAMISIHAAGSGHPGGSFSIMDIMAALFLNIARITPEDPIWEFRDRIFLSAGHKAPALYAALVMAGFYKAEEIVTLRKYGSPFQGHPHGPKVRGIEVSTCPLRALFRFQTIQEA